MQNAAKDQWLITQPILRSAISQNIYRIYIIHKYIYDYMYTICS